MQPDRFARKIVGILAHSGAARLRRLMRHSFGRRGSLVGSQSFEPDDVAAVIAAVRPASTPPHAHGGATRS